MQIPGGAGGGMVMDEIDTCITSREISKALILVGEVLPHPSDTEMNKRVNTVNFVK